MSCYKEPSFALQPNIEFQGIQKEVRIDVFTAANKDSVVIGVKFQDGDGDLGLAENEKSIAQQNNDYNYLVKTFRKKNGVFAQANSLISLSGYFPRLKNDDKVGPIEGILYYTVEFPHPFTPKNDTLKFEIQVKDRSGNISNAVETDEVVLNVSRL
jgi:hypothetical protein